VYFVLGGTVPCSDDSQALLKKLERLGRKAHHHPKWIDVSYGLLKIGDVDEIPGHILRAALDMSHLMAALVEP
jgi:hypothetical protein